MPGACANILLTCDLENFLGSFKYILVIPFDQVSDMTESTANQSFTAVTLDPTSSVWYKIEGKVNEKSFNSEGADSAGRSIHNKTIEMFVPSMNKTTAFALECFKQCRVVSVMVDNDGKAWVVGFDNLLGQDAGLRFNISEMLEGELTGKNGYQISLTGVSAELTRQYIGSLTVQDIGVVTFS